MQRYSKVGLAAILPILFSLPAHADAIGASFFDDFSTFDLRRWFVSAGWGSGDFQSCKYAGLNVKHTGTSLVLTLDDKPIGDRKYSCAEVQTRELYSYGTYETRMRGASASGTVSAFFSYASPNPQDEIDFELLGKNANAIGINYFADGEGNHGRTAELPTDGSNHAISYAFEWLPDALRWFIDGKLVHEVKAVPGEPFPKRPQKIFMSIWSGSPGTEEWLGPFSYPGKPLTAEFDYVAYTVVGGPCQFPESIVCKKDGDGR